MTDLIDLARRRKRSPGFEWVRGMRTLNEETVVFAYDNQQVEDEWVNGVSVFYGGYSEPLRRSALPDLSDPATVGCLEHQVDEDLEAAKWELQENGIDPSALSIEEILGDDYPALPYI